jgi:hypothetical protein
MFVGWQTNIMASGPDRQRHLNTYVYMEEQPLVYLSLPLGSTTHE